MLSSLFFKGLVHVPSLALHVLLSSGDNSWICLQHQGVLAYLHPWQMDRNSLSLYDTNVYHLLVVREHDMSGAALNDLYIILIYEISTTTFLTSSACLYL